MQLGVVVFFCANRDAWMLDLEDKFARCLMRDGAALPHGITESKRQFAIEWNSDFAIDGDVFVWTGRESGRTISVLGYPVRVIGATS